MIITLMWYKRLNDLQTDKGVLIINVLIIMCSDSFTFYIAMKERGIQQYLIQYVFVEVGHVAVIRHWTVIVVLEVLLQGDWIMRDVQHSVQVVRKHLRRKHRCGPAHFKRTKVKAHRLREETAHSRVSSQTHKSPTSTGSPSKRVRTAVYYFPGFLKATEACKDWTETQLERQK